jgi:hypothetical protein
LNLSAASTVTLSPAAIAADGHSGAIAIATGPLEPIVEAPRVESTVAGASAVPHAVSVVVAFK